MIGAPVVVDVPQFENPCIDISFNVNLMYSPNHHTATHCTITLGLTILHIFSRYCRLKAEVFKLIVLLMMVGQVAVGRATGYGMDGPAIESR
jgi:hypothetical protein